MPAEVIASCESPGHRSRIHIIMSSRFAITYTVPWGPGAQYRPTTSIEQAGSSLRLPSYFEVEFGLDVLEIEGMFLKHDAFSPITL